MYFVTSTESSSVTGSVESGSVTKQKYARHGVSAGCHAAANTTKPALRRANQQGNIKNQLIDTLLTNLQAFKILLLVLDKIR